MAVYVDDMFRYPLGQYRSMKMSHMIADTSDELVTMAFLIGVAPKWIQYPDTYKEHFDVSMAMRRNAVKLGAIEIDLRQYPVMVNWRRDHGFMPPPDVLHLL